MNYWVKGISRRWKDYRLVMIVTFIAAVFMSGMLLLQNIMNAYIMEQNYQYYGDWIVAARDEPLEHPYLSEHGRLAVAGNLCREYVKLWNAGAAPAADELVFRSPGMPLEAVPESLRKSCRFVMVVGEFAARYASVYGHLDASDEVVLTEGAEVYLPGWVGLILSK